MGNLCVGLFTNIGLTDNLGMILRGDLDTGAGGFIYPASRQFRESTLFTPRKGILAYQQCVQHGHSQGRVFQAATAE